MRINKLNYIADRVIELKDDFYKIYLIEFLSNNLHIFNENFDKYKFKNYINKKINGDKKE